LSRQSLCVGGSSYAKVAVQLLKTATMKTKTTRRQNLIAAALVCTLALTSAEAQELPAPATQTGAKDQTDAKDQRQPLPPQKQDGKWHFTLTPVGWIPLQAKGTAGIRGRTADFDLDTGDIVDQIIDHGKALVELHAELSHDRLTLFAEALYADFEGTRQGLISSQDITWKQGLFEAGATYAVLDKSGAGGQRVRIEALGGARIYYIASSIHGSLGILDVDASKTWVDGIVGARAKVDLNKTFGLFLRGDVGGGGSDLAWNVQGGVEIHLSRWASSIVGYKIVDWDYSSSNFSWYERIHGPFVATEFRF
jgi:hypothetical protein